MTLSAAIWRLTELGSNPRWKLLTVPVAIIAIAVLWATVAMGAVLIMCLNWLAALLMIFTPGRVGKAVIRDVVFGQPPRFRRRNYW